MDLSNTTKYQDIELEAEETMEMDDKKLVATTVSSRYVGNLTKNGRDDYV